MLTRLLTRERATLVTHTGHEELRNAGCHNWHDYTVSALDDDFHSLFVGRKPHRRDDRRKRARGVSQNRCSPRRSLRSPFSGRKPRRREDTTRLKRRLANPAGEGRNRQDGEGRSIGLLEWTNLSGHMRNKHKGAGGQIGKRRRHERQGRRNLLPHGSATHEMEWFKCDAFNRADARKHTGGRCNSKTTPPTSDAAHKSTAVVL